MIAISALWLPILLSAVIVFVVSSIIHMALPWHKGEYPQVPNEAKVMDALRPLAIPPGEYMIPRASGSAEMKSPEYAEKMKQGPVVIMTVIAPGPIQMGTNLTQWFIYALVISLFAAYVAGRALDPTAEYLSVFRFAGIAAFLGYTGALAQMSIWYKRSWRTTITSSVDGLIYALVTGGTFGWLWPR